MNKAAAKIVTALSKAVEHGKAAKHQEKGDSKPKIDTVKLAEELASRKVDQNKKEAA